MRRHRVINGMSPESYPAHPRVPQVSEPPTEGIVGQIGEGAARGEYVLVDPISESCVVNGPVVGYVLELPRQRLFDTDGSHLLDDGTYDDIRPAGQGGLRPSHHDAGR